jgi:glycosyltransferase involved in cell wall biosynthesis
MKIVYYNHTGKVSGAERMLLTAVARLDTNEFERVMVCPQDGPLAQMAADVGMTVATVKDLRARFTWRPLHLARYCKSFCQVNAEFRRKMIELNPDFIHANSIRAGLVATVATVGLKTKVVWHLHDLLPHHPLSSVIRVVAALSRRSRMIAVSEAVRKNFCGWLSALMKDRVTIIRNAIDLNMFSAGSTRREETRKALSLLKDDFAIGIVGQLSPRKGQLELLHAFEKLARDVPQAVLLIAGTAIFNRDDRYEQRLHETAKRMGISNRVKMLGARRDVPEIMGALDLLVVNSRREPFGLVACEAMACGTPVLATDRDGLPEIIDHQKSGWLVPFGDQRALVDALTFLHKQTDLSDDLGSAGRVEIARRFTIERYMNELNGFYRNIHNPLLLSDDECHVIGKRKEEGDAARTEFELRPL